MFTIALIGIFKRFSQVPSKDLLALSLKTIGRFLAFGSAMKKVGLSNLSNLCCVILINMQIYVVLQSYTNGHYFYEQVSEFC